MPRASAARGKCRSASTTATNRRSAVMFHDLLIGPADLLRALMDASLDYRRFARDDKNKTTTYDVTNNSDISYKVIIDELPVILHSRRTHDKLAMHLKRHALPRTGVVHGFSGSVQQAERFVQLGYKIGVGGTITYPRASKTREVMAQLPLDSLLLETDAPDMPLNGFQGQPNRPEQAVRVFDVLCELRPEPEDEIAEVLLNNTYAVFSVRG